MCCVTLLCAPSRAPHLQPRWFRTSHHCVEPAWLERHGESTGGTHCVENASGAEEYMLLIIADDILSGGTDLRPDHCVSDRNAHPLLVTVGPSGPTYVLCQRLRR